MASMNVNLLWALLSAVLLVGGGLAWRWLARRAGRQRATPLAAGPAQRAAAPQTPQTPQAPQTLQTPQALKTPPGPQPQRPAARAANLPPALTAGDLARLAAQRALATEALRQARRRAAADAAADAASLDAARLARPPLAAAQRPALARPAPPLPRVSLPPQAPSAAPPVPVAALAAATTPPTVLVVDDSKVVRIKTSRLLEKHHYRVLLADDGLSALQCLESQPADLVITDVEMPGLDGFGLTRRLRAHARWARLPVIMITSSDDRHRSDAAAVGVSVLLGKPYGEAAFLAEVHKALGSPVWSAQAALALQ